MKMNYLLSFLLFLLALAAAQQSGCTAEVPLGKEFELRFGQRAAVAGAGLRIEFVSVVEDSRCPTGTTCIWEGNAKVRLKVSADGKEPAEFELGTNLEPRRAGYHGYEIVLERLTPHPAVDEKIEAASYVASLIVRRGSSGPPVTPPNSDAIR
jgi:hypothetical protein